MKSFSDFVTNSYGESLDSSCGKSWVPVQIQWGPENESKIENAFFNQTVNLKTDSKTLYYSILKLKYSIVLLHVF